MTTDENSGGQDRYKPGDRVRSVIASGMFGRVAGKQFRPEPMWGSTEQYVVDWDDGTRSYFVPTESLAPLEPSA